MRLPSLGYQKKKKKKVGGEKEEIAEQMLGWQKVEGTVAGMMGSMSRSQVSSQSQVISPSDLALSPKSPPGLNTLGW